MTNTDAATFTTLLEELWEVDFETWKDIKFMLLNSMMFQEPRVIPLEQHIYHDIIQGCIQLAIAEKGWSYQQILYQNPTIYEAYLIGHREKIRRANTPAAAILAAYIEAVRARQ